jgi:hypothetical protein
MRKAVLIATSLCLSLVIIISCSKGGNTPNPPSFDCSGPAKSWATDVSPIIQTFCNQSTCHDVASNNGPGPLTNYAQVFSARSLIKTQVAAGLMPQNTTLTLAQKTAIVCWIDNGAPNN